MQAEREKLHVVGVAFSDAPARPAAKEEEEGEPVAGDWPSRWRPSSLVLSKRRKPSARAAFSILIR